MEDVSRDDEADDPSKWDLQVLGKWRRQDCMPILATLSTVSTTTPSAPLVATTAVTSPPVPAGRTTTAPPAATTAAPPATATTATNLPPVVCQKIDDDYLTGWKRKTLNIADYPKLETDTNYVPWKIKFTRQVTSHCWF